MKGEFWASMGVGILLSKVWIWVRRAPAEVLGSGITWPRTGPEAQKQRGWRGDLLVKSTHCAEGWSLTPRTHVRKSTTNSNSCARGSSAFGLWRPCIMCLCPTPPTYTQLKIKTNLKELKLFIESGKTSPQPSWEGAPVVLCHLTYYRC